MVIPSSSNIPIPNEYMTDGVKKIYNEARDVFPKSAKALLRLALQYLCVDLSGKCKSINDDIKN